MTVCTYLDPVTVHPDRYGNIRPMPPRWIVVHTSEQRSEAAHAAANLAAYMTSPGDRTTSTGSRYGSSYHDVIDLDMIVRPAVAPDRVAYSAPGSNTEGLHVCLPGLAGQTPAEWADRYSLNQIRTLAGYLIDQADRHDIPLGTGPLNVADLRAGKPGYTDHYRIGLAFGRTNHYDVGPAFPWDTLAQAIDHLTLKETPTVYLVPPPPERKGGRWIVVDRATIRLASSHDITDRLPQRPLTDAYRVQQYDDWLAVASNRQVPA